MLVVFRGLPGTGKTTLARQLVERRPDLLVLSRDSLRSGIFPRPTFSEEEKAFVDELILAMTGFLLDREKSVVIDGMALSSSRRLHEFADAARSRQTTLRIVECACSETAAMARLRADAGAHPAGDRGPDLYRRVRQRFEPSDLPFLRIDTETDPKENIEAVLGYIESPPV